MGKLQELLKKREQNNTFVNEKPKAEPMEEEQIKKYNQTWLLKVTGETGWIVNSDREHAQNILDKLNENGGRCPCGGNGKQYQCPCLNMRTYGICRCKLFDDVVPVQPTGKSIGRIKGKE